MTDEKTTKKSKGSAKTIAITAGVTGAVCSITAAALIMPGTSAVERGGEPVAEGEPTVSIETLPSETEAPTEDPSDEPAPSDGGGDDAQEGSEESTDEGVSEPSPKEVVLGSDEGTVYLRAAQDFSPELEAWTIDEEGGSAAYTRSNCLGDVKSSGFGSFGKQDREIAGKGHEVEWQGESPLHGAPRRTDIGLSGSTITYGDVTGDHTASTQTDRVLEQYGGMCVDAGKFAAGFIL